MSIEIVVPRLGWTMEEGIFVEWLKRDGDAVEIGDPLFVLESEKAVQEIEATDGGFLRIPPNGPDEGDTVLVGAVLGHLVGPGELAPFENRSGGASPKQDASDSATSQSALRTVPDTRPSTEDTENNVALSATGDVSISPRAARLAARLGVDWTQLEGSGRTGRIREKDVRAFAEKGGAGVSIGVSSPSSTTTAAPEDIVKMTSVRRTIASRMATGAQTTAPVTLTTTANASRLVALREELKRSARSADAVVPGFQDFIVKVTATVLSNHRLLNARWNETEIVASSGVHIGIAVDTDDGLLVPVVRDVPTLSLGELATKSRLLAEHARARKLSVDELQGGTFTVTNLGAYGVDTFTPIINVPQCAILGLGRIHRQPVVDEDQIVIREMMSLSLTFDHRIVDGAPAARFLDAVRSAIEAPDDRIGT